MPKKRPPKQVWLALRKIIWERDGGECVRCHLPVALKECNIDHIQSGKLGTNKLSNLRTLCKRCHVLRLDPRHRGMIAKALADELIPPNYRELLWED